ncbi:hypothetical protein C8A01DRAFT_20139 [Parachaetomium inaequale]|uniref:Secreted protein n=1 Tax=Parachaetomium inaequale TaxID=2588326 RepID=A0AAN6SLK0_9PEZI|nr:hypothetical protein C8A01DRAFT_20139 [Parachaetomium inaequale]
MRFITFLSVVSGGLGTALAAPRNLHVKGVSVLGTGCPYGSADVTADPSNTALEIRLSEYVVRTGPGTMASDWRKNCKLTLNLEYDAGFQFSTLNTAITGFAYIPSGAQGQCQNSFSFTGAPGEVNYGINLSGGRDGRFSLSANPDIAAWSPCGGSTAILNMNTQCWISPTEKQALIAVDRISSKLTVHVDLEWRNC